MEVTIIWLPDALNLVISEANVRPNDFFKTSLYTDLDRKKNKDKKQNVIPYQTQTDPPDGSKSLLY